jgi:sugar lactone lactonase YvrE
VSIQFTPQFSGLRRGAFKLVDTSSNVLATYYFSGTGAGTAPVFSGSATTPAVTPVYSPSIGYPFGVTVDAAGNSFVVDEYNNQVLRVTPNKAVTVVALGTTLNAPYDVKLDAAGNLYIADAGNNRILKLPYGSSTASVLNITGLNHPEGVAVDGAGNIFVANTRAVVTGGTGNIIELTASGTQSTLSATGLKFPSTLAIDAVGDVFIADTYNNRVLELPASGLPVTIGTGLSLAAAVAVDAAGDVFIADKNNGRVVEVPATSSGPGTGAQITLATGLLMPTALALDGHGDVFVADIGTSGTGGSSVSGNVVELQISNATQTISFNPIAPQDLGTSPTLAATASSGLAVSFSSYTPSVCTVSGSTATLLQSGTCTILASQPGGGAYLPAPSVVRSFTVLSAGGTLTTTFSVPAGVTLGTPQVFTEGVLSSALRSPDFTLASTTCTGAVSGSCTVNVNFTSQYAGLRRGAVKLVDTSNNLIATGYVSGIGANSQAGFTAGPAQKLWASGAVPGVTVDGAGNIYFVTGSAQIYNTKGGNFNLMPLGTTLNSPFGLALDGAGNLYIADSGNNRILELPYGTTTAVALNVTGLNYPQAVAVDGAGNIFITNTRGTATTGNGTVIELASGSLAQSTVIGTGLSYPVGVTFDSSGDLFVADWGASRVLEVSVSGESTSIGTGLANASAVGVDALGDVFIADQNNNRLVEIPGTASGPGTGTQVTVATGLLQPHGMVLDGPGNVYVSDLGTTTTYGNVVKVPNQ